MIDGRVNYICGADYSENSELDKVIKLLLDSFSITNKLLEKEQKQRNSLLQKEGNGNV